MLYTASLLQEENNFHWNSLLLQERLVRRRGFRNEAAQCAASVLQSETARVDGNLCDDVAAVLCGNAFYIRQFACEEKNMQLYEKLKSEIVAATGAQTSSNDKNGLIEWSRHQIFDNPTDISDTFNDIIAMLSEYFDVEIYATRLNYYRDGQQWKPQHHDSHAYGGFDYNKGEKKREDFTVGITLGATRSLLFVHEVSGYKFEFPQRNGDCFAFTSEVNTTFTHGVPRVQTPIGDRFSIIVWGRRRTLNERNSGRVKDEKENEEQNNNETNLNTFDDVIEVAHKLVSRAPKEAIINSETTTITIANTASKKKKKNRLQ